MSETLAWSIALGVLGAIVGSFVATIVVRWPQGRSVTRGRSACDACGAPIAARDLVPLASALSLRGRGRCCGAAIDARHWRIEALAAALGAAAGVVVGGPEAVAGAVFGWLLLTAAALDWDGLWIPDRVTATIALIGLATAALFDPPLVDRAIGGAGGFIALWAIGAGYRGLRGREGLGGADPKLLGAIGLWLGWQPLPAVVTVAALVGLGVTLIDRMRGGDVARTTEVPLGTYLAIAAYPAWLLMIGLRG